MYLYLIPQKILLQSLLKERRRRKVRKKEKEKEKKEKAKMEVDQVKYSFVFHSFAGSHKIW